MDERKMLEDAKKTLESIQSTQGALEQYEKRLEAIVRKLEAELYKDEKLTIGDVTSINKQLSPEMFEEEIDQVKEGKKKKFRINFLLALSILFFMITFFIQFVRLNDVIQFNGSSYFIYNQVNMEPSIKMNSLVVVDNSQSIQSQDVIAYYTKHKTIRVKQIDKVENDKYVIKNVEQTIKAYEELNKNDAIGVVKKTYPQVGEIITVLSQYIIVLYLISLLSFVIGLLIN